MIFRLSTLKEKLFDWVHDIATERIIRFLDDHLEDLTHASIRDYIKDNYIICEKSGALVPKDKAVKGKTVLKYKENEHWYLTPDFAPFFSCSDNYEDKPNQEEIYDECVKVTEYFSPAFAPKKKKKKKK
jgi:hypothetical protein